MASWRWQNAMRLFSPDTHLISLVFSTRLVNSFAPAFKTCSRSAPKPPSAVSTLAASSDFHSAVHLQLGTIPSSYTRLSTHRRTPYQILALRTKPVDIWLRMLVFAFELAGWTRTMLMEWAYLFQLCCPAPLCTDTKIASPTITMPNIHISMNRQRGTYFYFTYILSLYSLLMVQRRQ